MGPMANPIPPQTAVVDLWCPECGGRDATPCRDEGGQVDWVWFPSQNGPTDARDRLREIVSQGWFDPQVRLVRFELPTYNGETGLFTYTRVDFEVQASGGIVPKLLTDGWQASPYWETGTDLLMFDALFAINVVYLFLSELRDLYKWFRSYKYQKQKDLAADQKPPGCIVFFFERYVSVWNLIDWWTIFGTVFVCYRFLETMNTADHLRATLESIPTEESEERYGIDDFDKVLGLWGWSITTYFDGLNNLMDAMVACSDAWGSLRNVGAFFGLGICLRFIKSFRANQRMNTALTTLKRAGTDVVHYFIVFGALLLGFVFLAHILFGTTHEDFSNVVDGTTIAFLLALRAYEGQFANEHRVDRALWYWLFMTVVGLLMVMLLTSMIVDIFLDVVEDSRDSSPMWTQLLERRRDWKKWIALNYDKDAEARGEKIGRAPRLDDIAVVVREKNWPPTLLVTTSMLAEATGIRPGLAKMLLYQVADRHAATHVPEHFDVRIGDVCRSLQRVDAFMEMVKADNEAALGVVSMSMDKMRPNPVKEANKRRAQEISSMLDEVLRKGDWSAHIREDSFKLPWNPGFAEGHRARRPSDPLVAPLVQASTGQIVKKAEKQSQREGLTEDQRRLRDFQRQRTEKSEMSITQ